MPAPCNLTHSPRLRAVLRPLLDGAEHSTLELVRASGQCAVDSAIRELRQAPNHLEIIRTVRALPDRDGRKRPVHFYRLAPESRRTLLIREAERLLAEVETLGATLAREEAR